MDKDRLTAHINDSEARQNIKKTLDLYNACKKSHSVRNTKFLTPNEVALAKNILQQLEGASYKAVSPNPEAERQIICFYPEYIEFEDLETNLSLVKIARKYPSQELTHRDYLGALVSLGIERENIGDIVFDKETNAYVIILKPLDVFLMHNLSLVKNERVQVEIVNELPELDSKFEDLIINIASTRLDAIIARILNLSREKSQNLIQSGRVFVDYSEIKDKAYLVRENSILSIRGYGKYKFEQIQNETKKGRLSAKFLKYTN